MIDDYDALPMWEEYAQEAIKRQLEFATFDDIRGTIRLPPPHDDSRFDVQLFSMEELEEHLREIYNQEWYAYVPFEGGEAVFEDDAWEVVEDLLSGSPQFSEFFENTAPLEGTETLITARELLLNPSASEIVRISFEEINDELIKYLSENPEKMRELSPRKFEELVADMFKNQGFEVTLTPSSKDGGMDVIAVQKNGIGTVMIIVECKRYSESNKVGVEIVRGLYGVVEEKRATRGIIATTSYFTKGAHDFQTKVPYRLGLADYRKLTQELESWKQSIIQNQ